MPGPSDNQSAFRVRIITERQDEDARAGRRLAAVLGLLCAGVIVLASFYPFQPIHDSAELALRLRGLLHSLSLEPANLDRLKPGHLLLNFCFYLPLGVLVAMTLAPAGKRAGAWLTGAGAAALGFLMSLIIEYLQIGYNHRDPDLSDTAMNTLGYLAGMALMRWMMATGRFSPAKLAEGNRWHDRQGLARLLVIGYGLMLLGVGLLRPTLINEEYVFLGRYAGSLSPLPKAWLSPLDPWTQQRAIIVAAVALCFVPLGFLFRQAHYIWNLRRYAFCLVIVVLLAGFLEAAHVTLPGKAVDLARILGAALGAKTGADLAGWRRRRRSGFSW